MLLAREQGLHSCAQAAWANYHVVLRDQLPISEQEVVACGMAIGYADPDAIENSLVTEWVDSAVNVLFLHQLAARKFYKPLADRINNHD